LVGLSLPLPFAQSRRLVVEGRVGKVAARVRFDLGSAISRLSSGCLPDARVGSSIRISSAFSNDLVLPITKVRGAVVGTVTLAGFPAALEDAPGCLVTLGTDELAGTLLDIDFSRDRLEIHASGGSDALTMKAGVVHPVRFALSREPRFDWPLFAFRLSQRTKQGAGVAVFSTLPTSSALTRSFTEASNLATTAELSEQGDSASVPLTTFELAPGAGIEFPTLMVVASSRSAAVSGVIAADIWGQFRTLIDVGEGTVTLLERTGSAAEDPARRLLSTSPLERRNEGEPLPEDPRDSP
jgi:hypothetical protein